MNYGYVPASDRELAGVSAYDGDPLHPSFADMYAKIVFPVVPLDGLQVLDVGCGRGGGSAWLARTQRCASVVGIDLCGESIRLCEAAYAGVAGLSFVKGDALDLPVDDQSVDVVVCVESCQYFSSFREFFAEVHRVLRPGGALCVGAYFSQSGRNRFLLALQDSSLAVVGSSDITDGVIRALHATDDLKRDLIARHVPWWMRPMVRRYAAVSGSRLHAAFVKRKFCYHSAVARIL